MTKKKNYEWNQFYPHNMDPIYGTRFVISFLRKGKYKHRVNDLQKHRTAVAWCDPICSAHDNHCTRTGWGLPQQILWVITCSLWQWPILTHHLVLGSKPVPTWSAGVCSCVRGLRTGGTNLNIWSHAKFTSSHATPATRGEEHMAALSKDPGYLCTAEV